MRYFQLIRVTGSASVITYDGGLKSTHAEPKRLIACHIQLDSFTPTDDNEVQGYHERQLIFDIPDKMFPTKATNQETTILSEPMSKAIPVDLDIPAGESFKVALKCAASARALRGMYEYEIIS